MTRRVIAAGAQTLRNEWSGTAAADGYFARLTKYAPIETLALYVAACGLLPVDRPGLQASVAALCLFATPIYLRWATRRDDLPTPRLQIAFATLAFPCWVFALGGWFAELEWYADARRSAAVLLVVATVGFPLFAPGPGE